MSLKAKIEAVIYASEEPVTLSQLAGLLGYEAQHELDQLNPAQHSLALNEDGDERSPADQNATDGEALARADEPEAQLTASEARADEELQEHLQQAAAEEAAHTRTVREHAAADEAAMNTADFLNADKATVGQQHHGGDVPAEAAASGRKDAEKRLAREARERERRLREYLRSILDELIADYATSDRGLEVREVAGGYRLATKPEYHDAVRGFVKSLKPPLKLTLQALETLAVVAYKQPVTAPEVSEIRGVDSGGVLGSLMARKLVATAGRKQVIGRPFLYKTTKDFLLSFGLKDINELPSIEEFEKMAGELAEQEEIPMGHHAPETAEEVERERDETEPQADGDGSSVGETVAEEATVDGRISGLPPNYDSEDASQDENSPALDAEIQSDEQDAAGERR